MQFSRLALVPLLFSLGIFPGCQSLTGSGDPIATYEATRRDMRAAANGENTGVRQVSYEQEQKGASTPVDDDSGISVESLSPANISKSFRKAVGRGPNQAAAQELYDAAEVVYKEAIALEGSERTARFEEAARQFAVAAARWPDSGLEEDGLFKAGESWFFADHYPNSRNSFDELVKKFPNTRHLDVVDLRRFAIAQYWSDMDKADPHWALTPNVTDRKRPLTDTFGHSIKVYDRIRLDDPTGRLADDATLAAANAMFAKGRYDQADVFYTDYIRTYPSAPNQFEAHMLSVKCKLKLYQGADYDSASLDEAEELITRIHRIFPQESANEKEYLENAYKQIRTQKAQRHWTVAEFYDRRKEYGAARFYYRKIMKDFPNSNLSEQAEKRIAEVADLPDTPPDRFTWITRWFEDPKRRRR